MLHSFKSRKASNWFLVFTIRKIFTSCNTFNCVSRRVDAVLARRQSERRGTRPHNLHTVVIGLLQLAITWYKSAMLEGKLMIIPALGHQNKETWTSEAWLAFVLMSQWACPPAWRILYHVIVSCKRPTTVNCQKASQERTWALLCSSETTR